MDISRLILLAHTIKYLRFKQIYYRLFYGLRNRFFKKEYKKPLRSGTVSLTWKNNILYSESYKNRNRFEFLNLLYEFESKIDWNYDAYGKLWTYNLNYFDFLNQGHISKEQGLELIQDYIEKDALLKDGKEPYPISLRGINWIKFLSEHGISDEGIDQTLYDHYQILFHNVEYHLLGNHLLENGYSLFFGGYYFEDEMLYKKAKVILKEELTEQILEDGAHFELSPMYHRILLHRLLDCIQLVRSNPWKENGLLPFLKEKASKMLGWLQTITYSNGNIPMVNDSAYGIAPKARILFEYAVELGVQWTKARLMDSGYRFFKTERYELFVDVGNIGPTYQPGHAHSDTFSFELYVDEEPVIVDTGTSTYEKNAKRQIERETAAHNTVKIANREQTQVWGGFRVAKRARTIVLKENDNEVKAVHDGYKGLGVLHTRRFMANTSDILIEDSFSKEIKGGKTAFFHFHPTIKNIEIAKSQAKLIDLGITLDFKGSVLKIEKKPYEYALGFNKTAESQKIIVSFHKTLQTRIIL